MTVDLGRPRRTQLTARGPDQRERDLVWNPARAEKHGLQAIIIEHLEMANPLRMIAVDDRPVGGDLHDLLGSGVLSRDHAGRA